MTYRYKMDAETITERTPLKTGAGIPAILVRKVSELLNIVSMMYNKKAVLSQR